MKLTGQVLVISAQATLTDHSTIHADHANQVDHANQADHVNQVDHIVQRATAHLRITADHIPDIADHTTITTTTDHQWLVNMLEALIRYRMCELCQVEQRSLKPH